MTTPELKLLNCPFCGDKPDMGSLGGDQENWAIWCPKCSICCSETGVSGESKDDIIKAWNTRVKPAVTDEMVERAYLEHQRVVKKLIELGTKPENIEHYRRYIIANELQAALTAALQGGE